MAHERFVLQEAKQVVARYVALEEKNRSISATQIRMYALLLLYAAAPYSAPENYFDTGFLRVWGFGGLWLAGVVWMHVDRGYRAYGRHLFERIYCLRHLACLRQVVYENEEQYRKYSLLVSSAHDLNRKGCGDPTHVSSSQATVTAYFYKLVSLFPPLYFILFLSLILAPAEMLDPSIKITRLLYFRFILGFSFVIFLWGASSTRNCMAFQEQAYCARRISINNPWPLFPKKEIILPVYVKVRKIVNWTLSAIALVMSGLNIARLYTIIAGPGIQNGWQSLDLHLLYVTAIVFAVWVLYVEIDSRCVLWVASKKWKSPKNWLDKHKGNPAPTNQE